MSVNTIAAAPASSNFSASDSAVISAVSAQPSTATQPSRASMRIAIRPGRALQAGFTSRGSGRAKVARWEEGRVGKEGDGTCEVRGEGQKKKKQKQNKKKE